MNDTQQIITTTSALTVTIITIVLTGVYVVWQWLNKTKAEIQDDLPDDPTDKIDTLTKKLEDFQTLINALYERVTSVQSANVELASRLTDVTSKLATAEKHLGDFKELVATLQNEKGGLIKERDTALENEKAGLTVISRQNEIIEHANEQIEKLQKRIHELELANTALENRLKGIKDFAGALKVEWVTAERQKDETVVENPT